MVALVDSDRGSGAPEPVGPETTVTWSLRALPLPMLWKSMFSLRAWRVSVRSFAVTGRPSAPSEKLSAEGLPFPLVYFLRIVVVALLLSRVQLFRVDFL